VRSVGLEERVVSQSVTLRTIFAACLLSLAAALPAEAESAGKPNLPAAASQAPVSLRLMPAKDAGVLAQAAVSQRKVSLDLSRLAPSAFGDWEPPAR
jgi:hypothetical protein